MEKKRKKNLDRNFKQKKLPIKFQLLVHILFSLVYSAAWKWTSLIFWQKLVIDKVHEYFTQII